MENSIFQTIKKLEDLKISSFKVLSVYLGTNSKKPLNKITLITQLHSLAHNLLETDKRGEYKKQLENIESFIQEKLDTHGKRSFAFFVAHPKLFEVLSFEFFIQPNLVLSNFPYLSPLKEMLEWYKKYIVIIADRKKARFFSVHLGEIREHTDLINGIVPQKVRANEEHFYGRSDKIFRHIEDHLHVHLKLVAQKAIEFLQGKKINFIILGGHKEFLPKIKHSLPNTLRKKVLGEFVAQLNVPLNQLLLKSKKIAEKIELANLYKKMEVNIS